MAHARLRKVADGTIEPAIPRMQPRMSPVAEVMMIDFSFINKFVFMIILCTGKVPPGTTTLQFFPAQTVKLLGEGGQCLAEALVQHSLRGWLTTNRFKNGQLL